MTFERRQTEYFSFLFLLALAAVLGFLISEPFINDLLIAGVTAMIFYPLYLLILRYLGGRETFSSLLCVAVILIVILIPLMLIGYQIFKDAEGLYSNLAGGNAALLAPIAGVFGRTDFFALSPDALRQYTQDGLNWIAGNIGLVFSSFSRMFLNLVITLFALFYFLRDGKNFREEIIKLSPLSENLSRNILKKIEAALHAVIKGSLVIALLQGILTAAAFWLFGVQGAALWGAVTVIASFIPAVGSGLIYFLVVIYFFLTKQILTAVGFLIWGTLLVVLSDNVLRPAMIKRDIEIHPFLILLSVLGGISFFGVFGFVWGPLILALLFVLLDYYPIIILGK